MSSPVKQFMLKMRLSQKNLVNLMYAVTITKSSILSVWHLGLHRFDRKVNSTNCADYRLEIREDQKERFENLSGMKLQTNEEFQGKIIVN